MGRFRYITAAGVALVAALASGCGSSSGYSTPSVVHPALLPAQQPLEKQVGHMVLTGGDIAGWKVYSRGFEELNQQFIKAGTPGAAGINRYVRQHWKASYHTFFKRSGRYVASDANVFDSTESAQKVRQLELTVREKGEVIHDLPTPADAPPGSQFSYVSSSGHSGYQLSWVQGQVISIVVVITDHPQTAAETRAATTQLTAAAAKQANRVSNVMEAHAASMAAK